MFEWNLTSSAESNLRTQSFAKLIFVEFIFTIVSQKPEMNWKCENEEMADSHKILNDF